MNEKDSSLEIWQKVKFGEIVRNVTEAEREPAKKGLERVIGLEHIDPGSLRIRRWDTIEEGTSFTRVFRKGQVLFGKRRAYQRKAALAEFDGICSSDIYVFEANKDKLIPELLPFIVQDDRFFDFAIGTSSGSLSPRTKWKFLATYEIYLPPISEQKRIAEILWAAEDVIVKNETFLAEAEHYKQLMMRDLFSKGIGHTEFKEDKKIGMVPKTWIVTTLGNDEYFYLEMGQSPPSSSYNEFKKGLPFIQGVTEFGSRIPKFSKYCSSPPKIAKKGDILISVRAPVGDVNLSYCDICIGRGISTIRCHNAKYIEYVFNYLKYQKKYFDKISAGSIFEAITKKELQNFIIPIPPEEEIEKMSNILIKFDETIGAARETIESTKALKMKLINELLSVEKRNWI